MTLPTRLRRPPRTLTRDRLTAANVAADEAIASYEAIDARLRRDHAGSPSGYEIAKRDSKPLADAAGKLAHKTALANRLALALIVDLLTELVGRDG